MRVWIVMSALLLASLFSETASAKFVSHELTVSGPGMESPTVIEKRRLIDRFYIAILARRPREKVPRPASVGPSYAMTYSFAIGDDDGERIGTVEQTLFPFAESGAVVHTKRGAGFETSYGGVHFRGGWYPMPDWAMANLQAAGLPGEEPVEATAAAPLDLSAQSTGSLDAKELQRWWLLSIIPAFAVAWFALRRQS